MICIKTLLLKIKKLNKYLEHRQLFASENIQELETKNLNLQSNTAQMLDLLDEYKNFCQSEYKTDWKNHQSKLHRYETSKKDFKDWVMQNDRYGKVSICNNIP